MAGLELAQLVQEFCNLVQVLQRLGKYLRNVELVPLKPVCGFEHFFGDDILVLLVIGNVVKQLVLALLHVAQQFAVVDLPALKGRHLVLGGAVDLHKRHDFVEQLPA